MNNETKITDVQINPVRPQDGLIAFASVIIFEQFRLNNIALRTTLNGGYRLVFPAKKLRNGAEIESFHPITAEATVALTNAIVEKYEDLMFKE